MGCGMGEGVGAIFTPKVRGVVKWFNVRGGHCFIKRNDKKEDMSVPPTAINTNPKKLCAQSAMGRLWNLTLCSGRRVAWRRIGGGGGF